MQYQNAIASVRLGIRTIAGTDWPIERNVYKLGSHRWQAVTVCNGTVSDGRMYRTRGAAMFDLHHRR